MLNVNLLEFYNEKNKIFMEKCINHDKECLGIYSNKLKEIAKNNKDNLDYIEEEKVYQDEFMICSFMFSYIKDYNIMKNYLRKFINQVTNWAICDSLVSSLKLIKKHQDDFLKELAFYDNDGEYSSRFIFVVLKCYYIEEKYLDIIFSYLDNIKSNYYYVKMAKAWLLCDMLIKEYDKTLNYLNRSKLDNDLKKFLIRKVKDTYRLNEDQKNKLIEILGD